jgi:fumarate reductase flavoprotein subunit
MARMQETMTAKVAIFRDGERLQEAVTTLQDLLARSYHLGLRTSAAGASPELVAAYRVRRMLKLALCVACGALQRTESRGAHFRADFPRRNDRDWMLRTLARWADDDACVPQLDYEALDIAAMELPPGWRGYGAKDFIEHPHSAAREDRIEQLLASIAGTDKEARQEAVMPFLHLLPEHLRGPNQRLGDPQ